jgi:adenylate kinase
MMEEVADIDLVVNLKLREDALIAKCLGRRICSQCGGNFNLARLEMEESNSAPRIFMPPLLPPPSCASKMTTRADDTEEVVRTRLRIYYEEVCSSIWTHDY